MPEEQPQTERRPIAAFVLALPAGLWMLMPGVMRYCWGPPSMEEWRWGGGMWHHGMMRDMAPVSWWPWFGSVTGLIVLVGAAMLYSKPGQRHGWGMVIVVLSALNLFLGMGGFLASMLGIIGGALALAWRP